MGFNGEPKTQLHGNPKMQRKTIRNAIGGERKQDRENDFVAGEFGIIRKNLHNSEKSSTFAALK